MNYVCTVVGKLVFDDINLELNYMEIIDLSPADFKGSPRLREAFRNKQLVSYDPRVHPNAKRFNRFTKDMRIASVTDAPEEPNKLSDDKEIRFSEVNQIKVSLEGLAEKMNGLVSKMNVFISQQVESNEKLNKNFDKFFEEKKISTESFDKYVDKSLEYHTKMNDFWEKRLNEKDERLNKLINKLDEFLDRGVNITAASPYNYSAGVVKTDSSFDDKVTFVPELNIANVKSSIKSQEIQQEGTDDVLAKLRAMKK
jgi:vacuolar-type H+-ATPase subunit I/STV1